MFTAAGFEKTFAYIELFKQGLVCTISLSVLTVLFGFILALILAVMRLSDVCPFRYLALTRDGPFAGTGISGGTEPVQSDSVHRDRVCGSVPGYPYAGSAVHHLLRGL